MSTLKLFYILMLVPFICGNCVSNNFDTVQIRGGDIDTIDNKNLEIVNFIKQNKITCKKNILIPLETIYSDKTINEINEGDYQGSFFQLVMDFIIEDNSIVYGNNDRKRIEWYDIFQENIVKANDYPVDKYVDKDYSLTRIFKNKDNDLVMSTLDFHIIYNFKKSKFIFEENGFSKNSLKKIRVLKDFKFIELSNYNDCDLIEELVLFSGWDICKDFSTNSIRAIFAGEDKILMYLEDSNSLIELSPYLYNLIDVNKYDDVDILTSGFDEIGFVLKSGNVTEVNDIYVLFDVKAKKIKSFQRLESTLKLDTHFGDPLIFSSGSVYKIYNNNLWRLRTTKQGVNFEFWELN